MTRLAGKKALITGGTSGIGLATAQLFQEEGAQVAVTGRNAEGLARARQILGDDAMVLSSDAGRLDDIEHLMAEVGQAFGKLDILFLNAGLAKPGSLEKVTEADFDELIAINLKGVFFAVQKALPLLSHGASVIVTTSIANRVASPNASIYAATKAGTRSLVQALAVELIAKGIRINAVSPGPIDTPMFGQDLPEEIVQRRRALINEKSPCKRWGTPMEIAKTVLFLGSDDSSYILGEEIVVDGSVSLLRPFG